MDVGIRDLKAHLSDYIDGVAKGRSLTVTKRGKPVARIVSTNNAKNGIDGMVEAGMLELATKPLVLPEPIKASGSGKSASDLVIEGRR